MASYLVQAGTTLYLVTQAGVATAVTLPSGITLYGTSRPLRAAVFNSGSYPYVICVNGGTHDFFIDRTGTSYPLAIAGPANGPALSTGASTGLTGVYTAAITFKIKDTNGNTLVESALCPVGTSASLTNKSILASAIAISSNATVNSRGAYRSLSGGSTLYPWFDLDGNTIIAYDDGTADSLLSLLSTDAVNNGAPPDLKLISNWKDRLWGVPRVNVDELVWTEERVLYAWSATNSVIIPPKQTDSYGVTALIPRRDQLGVARHDQLHQIIGDSNDNFARTQVSPNIGCVSQESVVVIRDVAYFLGQRGVVEWTSEACGYVSETQVDPWFTSDDYFNRSLFSSAQGRYNPDTDSYELMLASLGSSTLDRWVSFDLKGRAWYGPHTSRLPISCCATDTARHGYLTDSSSFPIAAFGGIGGYLYRRDATTTDDDGLPVDFDVTTPVLGSFMPEQEKVWPDPTLHSRVEPDSINGNTLTVTSKVGSIGADGQIDDDDPVVTDAALTDEYQRLNRPGTGRYTSFRFTHAANGEAVRIYGLEVPFAPIGRRDR